MHLLVVLPYYVSLSRLYSSSKAKKFQLQVPINQYLIWPFPLPLEVSSKMCFLERERREREEREKPCFFVTFNIIRSHIFHEDFTEISSSCSKDMKTFFFNINYFHRFFGFFWHFLVAKKLMTSAYNRWFQHIFTFNIL